MGNVAYKNKTDFKVAITKLTRYEISSKHGYIILEVEQGTRRGVIYGPFINWNNWRENFERVLILEVTAVAREIGCEIISTGTKPEAKMQEIYRSLGFAEMSNGTFFAEL